MRLTKIQKDYIEIYLDGMLPKGSIPPPQEHIDIFLKEKEANSPIHLTNSLGTN